MFLLIYVCLDIFKYFSVNELFVCKHFLFIATIYCHVSSHLVFARTSLIVVFFSKLQRRNLRIVYDAIGTLAEAVGGELNKVCYFMVIHCRTINLWPPTHISSRLFVIIYYQIFSLLFQGHFYTNYISPCFAACLSRHSHATINSEVAATFKFRQRSFSAPGMLYIYCSCMNTSFSDVLYWKNVSSCLCYYLPF